MNGMSITDARFFAALAVLALMGVAAFGTFAAFTATSVNSGNQIQTRHGRTSTMTAVRPPRCTTSATRSPADATAACLRVKYEGSLASTREALPVGRRSPTAADYNAQGRARDSGLTTVDGTRSCAGFACRGAAPYDGAPRLLPHRLRRWRATARPPAAAWSRGRRGRLPRDDHPERRQPPRTPTPRSTSSGAHSLHLGGPQQLSGISSGHGLVASGNRLGRPRRPHRPRDTASSPGNLAIAADRLGAFAAGARPGSPSSRSPLVPTRRDLAAPGLARDARRGSVAAWPRSRGSSSHRAWHRPGARRPRSRVRLFNQTSAPARSLVGPPAASTRPRRLRCASSCAIGTGAGTLRTSLGRLRRWRRLGPALAVPAAPANVTVRVWIPASARDGYEGRRADLALEFTRSTAAQCIAARHLRAALGSALTTAVSFLLGVALIVALVLALPAVSGHRSLTVLSGSMEPTLDTGSVVIDRGDRTDRGAHRRHRDLQRPGQPGSPHHPPPPCRPRRGRHRPHGHPGRRQRRLRALERSGGRRDRPRRGQRPEARTRAGADRQPHGLSGPDGQDRRLLGTWVLVDVWRQPRPSDDRRRGRGMIAVSAPRGLPSCSYSCCPRLAAVAAGVGRVPSRRRPRSSTASEATGSLSLVGLARLRRDPLRRRAGTWTVGLRRGDDHELRLARRGADPRIRSARRGAGSRRRPALAAARARRARARRERRVSRTVRRPGPALAGLDSRRAGSPLPLHGDSAGRRRPAEPELGRQRLPGSPAQLDLPLDGVEPDTPSGRGDGTGAVAEGQAGQAPAPRRAGGGWSSTSAATDPARSPREAKMRGGRSKRARPEQHACQPAHEALATALAALGAASRSCRGSTARRAADASRVSARDSAGRRATYVRGMRLRQVRRRGRTSHRRQLEYATSKRRRDERSKQAPCTRALDRDRGLRRGVHVGRVCRHLQERRRLDRLGHRQSRRTTTAAPPCSASPPLSRETPTPAASR